MQHVHSKFNVSKNSTFGLRMIHAILECRGDGCKYSEVKLLTYDQCDVKKTKGGYPTYYYPKGTGEIENASRKKTGAS